MTTRTTDTHEERRLAMQSTLDAAKGASERNRMGQFATPPGLAGDMLRYAGSLLNEGEKIRFIDPAVGTGAFYSALCDVFPTSRVTTAVGYEIDPHYGMPAATLWKNKGLDVRIGDFTQAETPQVDGKFNLLICNPPYVRHHHIAKEEKQRLQTQTRKVCGLEINGLAGLYCYFIGMCHAWLTVNGLAGWLVPSEFMDVNYGVSLKKYLLNKVTLLRVHRFNPNCVQFNDALVSSAVMWFRKKPPPAEHKVEFSYGDSLAQPKLSRQVGVAALHKERKWTRYPMQESRVTRSKTLLGDCFEIKRGLATGSNAYFILPLAEIERHKLPMQVFKPILPSPRYLPDNEIMSDERGNPILERRLFLLNCPFAEDEVRESYPTLWNYLEKGRATGVAERYLCRHRTPWYAQENRPPSPFVCTYLGRCGTGRRPFRFILNHSQATVTNVYLVLYPKQPLKHALEDDPKLKRKVWKFLNEISPRAMLAEGRVYGGGLHKLEPKELSNVSADTIAQSL